MLPNTILSQIFNLQYKPDDILIIQIAEELENYPLIVSDILNYDHVIIYKFKRDDPCISGYLRIDRIKKLFEICINCDGEMILPIEGDWHVIHEYLLNIFSVVQK